MATSTTDVSAQQHDTVVLFNNDLKEWQVTAFDRPGSVVVEDSVLILHQGKPMTGVHWTGDFPEVNYEVELDAKRVNGIDFFCGMTFPVRSDFCTLIVGGWGGQVVGLSSIDGFDASENETIHFQRFDLNTWYHIRLRVTDMAIQAWINDKRRIDFEYRGSKLSLREEVSPSRPFGFATWRTTAALKNIRLRTFN